MIGRDCGSCFGAIGEPFVTGRDRVGVTGPASGTVGPPFASPSIGAEADSGMVEVGGRRNVRGRCGSNGSLCSCVPDSQAQGRSTKVNIGPRTLPIIQSSIRWQARERRVTPKHQTSCFPARAELRSDRSPSERSSGRATIWTRRSSPTVLDRSLRLVRHGKRDWPWPRQP